jgi:lysophospholipase L1-like esterase
MPSPRPEHPDDNLMERFDREGVRRFRARDAIVAVVIAAIVLVVSAGGSVKKQAEEMSPGIGRDLILAVGRPTAWIANQLPFHSAANTLTSWLSPNEALTGPGFVSLRSAVPSGIPLVTPDAFNPSSIGAPAPPRRPLHTLLVTGDSMSMPLDQDLAQMLEPQGVKVIQDPHIGTGISNTVLIDWGKLSAFQVRQDHPDAVVVFIGANDGYSMPGPDGGQVNCCGPEWATIYANRVRQMMNTYRQDGIARVYWLTLPIPREAARKQAAIVVNAAIEVAAEPWLDQVRVLDMVPVFTPRDVYRDSMTVNGQPTIVRQSDGIHLNDAGSSLAAKIALAAIDRDFTR